MNEERPLFILAESGPHPVVIAYPSPSVIQNEESRFRDNV